ncbi:hypothetical protein PINS_up006743 [Pythium insidiosum]|nr:hypothetical protein PINS_up006743 [Pythium insidiosum]
MPSEPASTARGAAVIDVALPPLATTFVKPLIPVETPVTRDGERSARQLSHRSPDMFEAIVEDMTWLLHQSKRSEEDAQRGALASSRSRSSPRRRVRMRSSRDKLATKQSGDGTMDGSKRTSSDRSDDHDDEDGVDDDDDDEEGGPTVDDCVSSGATASKTRRQVAALAQRAYAQFRLGRFHQAIKDYTSCISSDPTSGLFFYNRGCAFYASRRRERALQDFTRALKLDTRNMLFIESRALLYKELGRFRDSIQDYAWLETLRRVVAQTHQQQQSVVEQASSPSTRTRRQRPSTTPVGDANASAGRTEAQSQASHGSFSLTLSDLHNSVLFGVSSGAESARSPSLSSSLVGPSFVPEELTTEERERSLRDWLVAFLRRPTGSRRPADIQYIARYVRTWSFFRGMDTTMIEQCLQEATHRHFETEQIVVPQGRCISSFHVVLDPVASLLKNVESSGGVSKLRELKKLAQGDAIGTDAFAISFSDGYLRTLAHLTAGPELSIHSISTPQLPNSTTSTGESLVQARMSGRSLVHRQLSSLPSQLSSGSLISLLQTSSRLGTDRSIDDGEQMIMTGRDSLVGSDDAFGGSLRAEPASFSTLDSLDCLVLDVSVYHDILQTHEMKELDDRIQFLRGCRVFQSCTEDVLTALAAAACARVYDPGRELLQTDAVVERLGVIRRGVCQVRKTIHVPVGSSVSAARVVSSQSSKREGTPSQATTRPTSGSAGGDGSWVLDNGWMLTNPRLVNNAQALGQSEVRVTEDVTVGILASGQIFGELCVLQPGQSSQVTIRAQTMVEVLLLAQDDLARLRVQYHSGVMNALQESLLFHNPPQQKIVQLRRDLAQWQKEKQGVLHELALHLPAKARGMLSGSLGDCSSGGGRHTKQPRKSVKEPNKAQHERRRSSLSPLFRGGGGASSPSAGALRLGAVRSLPTLPALR